jgi:hypothetical protein
MQGPTNGNVTNVVKHFLASKSCAPTRTKHMHTSHLSEDFTPSDEILYMLANCPFPKGLPYQSLQFIQLLVSSALLLSSLRQDLTKKFSSDKQKTSQR